jgi:hypothetical protein
MEEYNKIEEPSDSEGGLNQKLDYPFLLIYQMQKITQKFAEGNVQGGAFIVRIMESSCPFKADDGWKKEIEKLDSEFIPKFNEARSKKNSLKENMRQEGLNEEQSLNIEYWLRRFDILMTLNKMQNMLYKETETGEIR